MNRKIYILIHIVGWLAFFCSPMMFIDHSSNIDMLRYLFFSMMPFVLMVVFYINYFWLVPRYYIRGNHPHYYIINIISFVVFLIFLHLWMDWGHHIFNDTPPHKHAVDFVENHKAWFFSIRDIFNMTFAAAMAAMLRLSENWHKSEVARQEAEKLSSMILLLSMATTKACTLARSVLKQTTRASRKTSPSLLISSTARLWARSTL